MRFWQRLPNLTPQTSNINPRAGLGPRNLRDKAVDTQVRLDYLVERGGKRDIATLWLPWVSAAKSCRTTLEKMRTHLPTRYDCMSSINLDESVAAMVHYVGGIVTRPIVAGHADPECGFVLQQTSQNRAGDLPDRSWRLLWSGHRPGDRKEFFRLFAR